MAMKGISRTQVTKYVCEGDPGHTKLGEKAEGLPTVWHFRPFSARARAVFNDRHTTFIQREEADGFKFLSTLNQKHYDRVRFGLAGWDNWQDEDGNEIKFETVEDSLGVLRMPSVTMALMDRMTDDLISELADAMYKADIVTVAEAKS